MAHQSLDSVRAIRMEQYADSAEQIFASLRYKVLLAT